MASQNVMLFTYDSIVCSLKSLILRSCKSSRDHVDLGESVPCEQCFRWDFQDTLMRIMTAQEVVDKI